MAAADDDDDDECALCKRRFLDFWLLVSEARAIRSHMLNFESNRSCYPGPKIELSDEQKLADNWTNFN